MYDGLKQRLIEAVDHALAGDWQAAHLIVQDHEGERLANWIHAARAYSELTRSALASRMDA